jgi:hypothetical protein
VICGLLRAGRYTLRAAGSRGPAGPPKPWPVPARLIVAGVVLAVWWAMSWRSLVITLAVLVFLVTPACWLAAQSRREQKRDPLDVLMDACRERPEQRAGNDRDGYADPLARLQARYGITEEER